MTVASQQRFEATPVPAGSGMAVVLPFDPNAVWGDKQVHHVTGTVGAWPVRGALVVDQGEYSLRLGAAWLRDSGLPSGPVAVVLMPEGAQLATMPEDVVTALQGEPQARVFFESLATFYRKGYLTWIDGARKPEARAARLDEMVDLLKNGQKQR